MIQPLLRFNYLKLGLRSGWTTESNIYYNKNLFRLLDFGCGDLEIDDYPNRGLFWLRLQVLANPLITAFFSTAHLPWAGSITEIETGINQRIVVTHKVCAQLRRLMPPDEPGIDIESCSSCFILFICLFIIYSVCILRRVLILYRGVYINV